MVLFSSTTDFFLLLIFTITLTCVSASSHLRPTKKYLRCNVETFGGCGGVDYVNLCHYNGHEFVTTCVKSRSSIVEHEHAQDYCGQCVESPEPKRAFTSREELQQAVEDYIEDPTTHKRLSVEYGYPMGEWDVSQITDFSYLFAKRVHFNEDLGNWNMAAATSLDHMFWHAHSFTGESIGPKWDVRNVQTMEGTFYGAEQFSSNLEGWSTPNLTNLKGTFWRATSFNSPVNNWDTSKVTTMNRCFCEATSFNQPVHKWNTRQVTDMSHMFYQAVAFQQELFIGTWRVHHVTKFEKMFAKVPFFQQSNVQKLVLDRWDIQKGATVTHMFTAPRDVSSRAQQLNNLQLDVQGLMRTTTKAHNNNRTRTEEEAKHSAAAEELSREIRCHGGVCI